MGASTYLVGHDSRHIHAATQEDIDALQILEWHRCENVEAVLLGVNARNDACAAVQQVPRSVREGHGGRPAPRSLTQSNTMRSWCLLQKPGQRWIGHLGVRDTLLTITHVLPHAVHLGGNAAVPVRVVQQANNGGVECKQCLAWRYLRVGARRRACQ